MNRQSRKPKPIMKDANVIQWGQLKKQGFKRDHFRCLRCDTRFPDGNGLTAHHITPREEGGGTYTENLVTLCRTCHDFVEQDNTLRSDAAIIGSFDSVVIDASIIRLAAVEKAIAEGREAFERPAWHAWVYGGSKKPDFEEPQQG